MHGQATRDGGRAIDWSLSADDYGAFRPGPPPSFYARLGALGIGLPGQRILDLGTGTGVLARQFATQGGVVTGVDVAIGQIAVGLRLAAESDLAVEFRVATAEETGAADASFDVVTANQCWLYFDKARVLAEVRRVLAPGGVLVTSHFSYLSTDPVARATEALILRYNPDWQGANWSGEVPTLPAWSVGRATVRSSFIYDEAIPFTREAWRGRMRACRGVGPTLTADEVARFDGEHAALLESTMPEAFTVTHRIDAHVFEVSPERVGVGATG